MKFGLITELFIIPAVLLARIITLDTVKYATEKNKKSKKNEIDPYDEVCEKLKINTDSDFKTALKSYIKLISKN